MPQLFDFTAVFDQLGSSAAQADFALLACTSCGRQYLVDHECLRIYPEAQDLSRFFINSDPDCPPCLGCADPYWDLGPVMHVSQEWQLLVRLRPSPP